MNEREIRQVFEGQNRIHLEIKQLHRQLAMILDEQRRYVSVITDEIGKKAANAESGQVGRPQAVSAFHKNKSARIQIILMGGAYERNYAEVNGLYDTIHDYTFI